jgi:hypothetical protein
MAECLPAMRPPLPNSQLLPAGYLGPTSFIAGLKESVDFFSRGGDPFNTDIRDRITMEFSPELAKKTMEVFRCLGDFSLIRNLVQEYYSVTQTAVIASPLILNALNEIEVTVNGGMFSTASDEQLDTFSTFVILNTSRELHIPQTCDGAAFHKCFTGPFLRLEIIGVICAIAGRASYFGLAGSAVRNTGSRNHFSYKMLTACDLTMQICKNLTGLNDISLWLIHENLLLSKLLQGDSSQS